MAPNEIITSYLSVRQSPDGKAVAIQSLIAPDRWGVMHAENGGHWAADSDVADWQALIPDPDWIPPAKADSEGESRP